MSGSSSLVSTGKIVDSETKLVTVLAGLSDPGRAARADSGIVDENVEPVTDLANDIGEAAHLGEGGKICG